MIVVGIDLSTHTGFSVFEDGKLKDFGTIEAQKPFDQYTNYPFSYVIFAEDFIKYLVERVILPNQPDIIVVEQTVLGKQRFSQKKLEFLHCILLQTLKNFRAKVVYVDVSAWRQKLGLKASKEDLKNNRKVNEARRKGLKKSDLGLIGKVTPKHRSIRFINSKYRLDLKLKDNNAAEGIAIVDAYLQGVKICEGK